MIIMWSERPVLQHRTKSLLLNSGRRASPTEKKSATLPPTIPGSLIRCWRSSATLRRA